MDWIKGFLIPLIEIVIVGGVISVILYFIGKGFYNAWSHQTKFFFKYKIMRKKYPAETTQWCFDAINQGIGYYDAQKFLIVKMVELSKIRETMWIYDQILNELKGGVNKDGREFKGSDRKTESKSGEILPTIRQDQRNSQD